MKLDYDYYCLILRDPIYFNEYLHSTHATAKDAVAQAAALGKRVFRVELYSIYRAPWYNDMQDAREKNR